MQCNLASVLTLRLVIVAIIGRRTSSNGHKYSGMSCAMMTMRRIKLIFTHTFLPVICTTLLNKMVIVRTFFVLYIEP